MLLPTLNFVKMHGIGNDVVIIDTKTSPFNAKPSDILQLAHRHLGIGFDQLLLIKPSDKATFYCQIFNSDGSEASQCGNGLRCLARYVHEENLVSETSFSIETKSGIYPVHIKDYDHIRITMGAPSLQEKLAAITLNQETIQLSLLSLGNPHAIIKIDSFDHFSVSQKGAAIANHPSFKKGINVGFMQIMTPHRLKLRTFERGAGETLACGSNACAAVTAGIINQWLDHTVEVEFLHGTLTVEWTGANAPVYLTGPAERVFSGVIK